MPSLFSIVRAMLISTLIPLSSASSNTLNTSTSGIFIPPKPAGLANSTAYSLKVRPANASWAQWQSVPLYQPKIQEINATTGSAKIYNSSLAYFDYNDAVEVSLTPSLIDYPSIETIRVRPLSYGVIPEVHGREVRFRLKEPHYNVVVEVNGDVFNVLHIWSNSIEHDPITEEVASKDSSIIYFGPGYHSLNDTNGYVNLTSGQTLYLSLGAILSGGISIQNSSNVTVRGRGMLHGSADAGILIEYSNNVVVDSISVLNPGHYSLQAGSSLHLTVRDFRAISAVQWGDGIDLFCSQHVLLERLFLRTSDDSIAIYQHRWNYYGDSKNITIRDASLWADVAHPVHMGLHGNTVNPETMSDVTFENIDILDHREPQVDYQGAIAINAGDENLVQDIVFSNVRVEDFRWGMLLAMRVTYNPKYNAAPGRGIRNVTFKRLEYNGKGGNLPVLMGYDEQRAIEFVDFQGLKIDGLHVWDGMQKPKWYATSDSVPLLVGGSVRNVTFST